MHSESILSSPTAQQLAEWRVFLETAHALIDILDTELQAERGITLSWYDALVHLEEAEDGLPMNELADRILLSKSGLTRVIDRMEETGLVRRRRSAADRRVVKVLITAEGLDALHAARAIHHRGIQEHFLQHLTQRQLVALANALANVHNHARPLRPGRIS